MKRPHTLISKILYSSILIAFINCKKEEKKDIEQPHPIATVSAPEGIISIKEASTLYNNYTEHRADIIEQYEQKVRAPEKEFQVGRFVDFDYQTIKDYIAYVDQEAKNAGVEKVTKLRLYFANYPTKGNFPDGKPFVHPRQNSIFIVPTLNKKGEDYAFYIGENGKAELIRDLTMNQINGIGNYRHDETEKSYASIIPTFTLNSSLQTRGTSLALNRGNGGPPPRTDF
ncbi:hypothetical protein [Maribacter sp.]|uniref:hypothetical protein n=1 Tax=Maribacter sp. TaxID=1897614 RepID=UPI0025C4F5F9|nr:hypothetical protein [Maribacter sp.]